MFNSTFFKFLIAFAIIIGISFLIMGIVGNSDLKSDTTKNMQYLSMRY